MSDSTKITELLAHRDLSEHPIAREDWVRFWREGNDAGLGSPVGEDGQSLLEAGDVCGELIDWHPRTGALLYVTRIGTYVVVADANGPWAVIVGWQESADGS